MYYIYQFLGGTDGVNHQGRWSFEPPSLPSAEVQQNRQWKDLAQPDTVAGSACSSSQLFQVGWSKPLVTTNITNWKMAIWKWIVPIENGRHYQNIMYILNVIFICGKNNVVKICGKNPFMYMVKICGKLNAILTPSPSITMASWLGGSTCAARATMMASKAKRMQPPCHWNRPSLGKGRRGRDPPLDVPGRYWLVQVRSG